MSTVGDIASVLNVTPQAGGRNWNGAFFQISDDKIKPFGKVRINIIPLRSDSSQIKDIPYTLTASDPIGNQFKVTGAGIVEWFVDVNYIGLYPITVRWDDGTGTYDFHYNLRSMAQYNAGRGECFNIPLAGRGQTTPPWEWPMQPQKPAKMPDSYFASENEGSAGAAFSPDWFNPKWRAETVPYYLGAKFNAGAVVKKYSFALRTMFFGLNNHGTPEDWKFQGDMDDGNWIDLDVKQGQHLGFASTSNPWPGNYISDYKGPFRSYQYDIDNDVAYKRYRLLVTRQSAGQTTGIFTHLTFIGDDFITTPEPEYELYNRGDGVFASSAYMDPLNVKFHCDVATRLCRPINAQTSPLPPNVNVAATPPLRVVPPALLAHKRSRKQATCWCWAIKPKRGPWEAYTSLDRDIDLPEYTDEMGNTVPALTYKCAGGLAPTKIPVRVTLAKNAGDVTVLAFDRVQLQAQYYLNAEYECFEINYTGNLSERIVGSSGLLGNTTINDSDASIELIPWSDLANRPIGRDVTVLCDVGSIAGEEFGTGRCTGAAGDGPVKADWTIETTLTHNLFVSIGYPQKTRIAIFDNQYVNSYLYGGAVQTITGKPVPADWHMHLRNGKVLFLSGQNAGVERDIRTAFFGTGPGVNYYGIILELHTPLPFGAQFGDTVQITVGCMRTVQDCMFFNNIKNFRGFPYVPGREGLLRRWKAN